MTTTIDTARRVLTSHGFTINNWSGRYCIRRDIPAYGSSCPADRHFHRDYRSFHASEVSLHWVRRLADAIAMADASAVTPKACGEAWKRDHFAADEWDHAGWRHRWSVGAGRPDFTLTQQLDLGVRELRTGGAARAAELCRQVLIESWAAENPVTKPAMATA